ncbi:DeoR/GlpR family DNA-binding transcription regulator [Anaerococcus sp.]|uniref:DeoR/GlpR family DNA-binding transcription regulator n=1 Tax=Anaerococcus sp. TaxID=1872515 RepID=UPI002A74CC05|nr:DeoR/GlpR family DNA-binding transcription regulator [Anaerococcus sp.]MDD6919102.1 DeoR/GlpR family DNA-binding transcription regulator [Peptoniphilaceae bacterium]MDY2927440.1 DeoR/GlpR family DNA-binding transcription regulator [Anaerococcus sp.]
MIPAERYQKIRDILIAEKTISINDLSKRIYVSQSTIRRDIDYLEKSGFLIRIRGGVSIASNNNTEYSSFIRTHKEVEKKQYIAKLVNKYFLKNDLSFFLDDSTTVSILTNYIKEYSQIVAITNSIQIASDLNSSMNVKCLLSGGMVKFNTFSLVGLQVYNFLKSFYVDYLFISCKCLDKSNVYESDKEVADIKNIMLMNSKKKVLLVDSTKFNRNSFISNYRTTQFDYIVTDKKPSDEFIEYLKPFTKVIYE